MGIQKALQLKFNYPKKGQYVKCIIPKKRSNNVVEGIFTGKVFRTRFGAVLGTIETEHGLKTVPWTSNQEKVIFVF